MHETNEMGKELTPWNDEKRSAHIPDTIKLFFNRNYWANSTSSQKYLIMQERLDLSNITQYQYFR
jgi:hypothetical protein